MTRINVVPVQELCDQHLLAEYREITRIPNTIVSGKAKLDGHYPKNYCLGTGHVKFFYSRLKWLHKHYDAIHAECLARGFNVSYKWPKDVPLRLYNGWEPAPEDLELNRARIRDRMPIKARYYGQDYKELGRGQ